MELAVELGALFVVFSLAALGIWYLWNSDQGGPHA